MDRKNYFISILLDYAGKKENCFDEYLSQRKDKISKTDRSSAVLFDRVKRKVRHGKPLYFFYERGFAAVPGRGHFGAKRFVRTGLRQL